jgi:pimeloyl-ACP methyl ester carboxylesterase
MARGPVLFLPGTLCTGAVFATQSEALAPRAGDVLVADFRKERSIAEMAETAAALLHGSAPAAVIGFSMGGMVAIALAERYPERVDRLALLNSNVHADLPERAEGRRRLLAEARRVGLRQVIEAHFLKNYLYRGEPDHCRLILDMADEHGLDAFEAQAQALADRPDASATLASFHGNTLILGAQQDLLCPPAVQRDMLRLARNGRMVLLEECGHFAVLEKAREVNRALLDWLES